MRWLCIAWLSLNSLGCSQGLEPPQPTPIVPIPGGTFTMGSAVLDPCRAFDLVDERVVMRVGIDEVAEQVTHSVEVDDFCMDQHEVTNQQYAHCVAHGSCGSQAIMFLGQRDEPGFVAAYGDNLDAYAQYPAVGVIWSEAQSYCEFRGGRLPTEAEWEYAARSRGQRAAVWAQDAELAARIADGCGASDFAGTIALGTCTESALPVGQSRLDVTADGVFDMAGNVAEYTADAYDPFAYCDRSRPEIGAVQTWVEAFFNEAPDGTPLRSPQWPLLNTDAAFCGYEQVCIIDEDGECTDDISVASGFGGQCLNGLSDCIEACGLGRMPVAFQSCGLGTESRTVEGQLDAGSCVRACTDFALNCMACCTQPGAALVCAPTGSATGQCEPVPWCFPRLDYHGREPLVTQGNEPATPVVRGGHFMHQRSCDARPTRRTQAQSPRGTIGFRCVYDVEHPQCSVGSESD